jgi:hypothetical protein
MAAAAERNTDPLIEHPTHCQMNHAPVKAALSEFIELPNGVEVLGKVRRLEFESMRRRSSALNVVAGRMHPASSPRQSALEPNVTMP